MHTLVGYIKTNKIGTEIYSQIEDIFHSLLDFSFEINEIEARLCIKTLDYVMTNLMSKDIKITDFTFFVINSKIILQIILNCQDISISHSLDDVGNNCFKHLIMFLLQFDIQNNYKTDSFNSLSIDFINENFKNGIKA